MSILPISRKWLRTAAFVVACASPVLASAQPPLGSEVYVTGLTQPIAFVQDPGLPHVQYVAQQNGVIRVIVNGALRAQNFLNLSTLVRNAGEQGFLGLALAPDYATSGRLYVHFSRLSDGAHVVARFLRSTADPFQVDVSSRFGLLWPAMPDIHSNCTQPQQRIICQGRPYARRFSRRLVGCVNGGWVPPHHPLAGGGGSDQ
jgi:hypothetical protein